MYRVQTFGKEVNNCSCWIKHEHILCHCTGKCANDCHICPAHLTPDLRKWQGGAATVARLRGQAGFSHSFHSIPPLHSQAASGQWNTSNFTKIKSEGCIYEEDNHTHFRGTTKPKLKKCPLSVCPDRIRHEPEEPLGSRAALNSTRDAVANQDERKVIDNMQVIRASKTHWLTAFTRRLKILKIRF